MSPTPTPLRSTQPSPVGHGAAAVDIDERQAWTGSPAVPLVAGLVGTIAGVAGIVVGAIQAESAASSGGSQTGPLVIVIAASVVMLLAVLLLSCLTIITPGNTKVITFFGRYVGTVRRSGMVMLRPLASRGKLSIKVRNFETSELKVNDADGNPVNIAAIIVWQVADTAKASFAVEDYQDFVHVQAEAALRHVATSHPYDNADDTAPSLRGATAQVSAEIAQEVAERVAVAGIEVVEARISKLAYAPEIAQAMLQRQQAGAIIAAREKIVEGAVTMVESALARLEADSVVALDEERRAAMVSNLLVVLCGEARATPVVNTGTLYS